MSESTTYHWKCLFTFFLPSSSSSFLFRCILYIILAVLSPCGFCRNQYHFILIVSLTRSSFPQNFHNFFLFTFLFTFSFFFLLNSGNGPSDWKVPMIDKFTLYGTLFTQLNETFPWLKPPLFFSDCIFFSLDNIIRMTNWLFILSTC